ncbi:MAG: PEP-CTERM sorting domain-containing protein, partial [Phycisphaerae bacterium]|nr:PEP-CTERM sorting domain-containing protein [Phycisphaerae bacterium]
GAVETTAGGISDDIIVGTYSNTSNSSEQHGFIYDGTNWETLNFPGASYTQIHGIEGDTILGSYRYSLYGMSHGFMYIIPEPCTLLLLGLGSLALRLKRSR